LSFEFSHGLHGDDVVESQVRDISDQYGKKPDRVARPDGFIVQALWNLDNGNVLTLGNLGILNLQNQTIVTEAQKNSDRSTSLASLCRWQIVFSELYCYILEDLHSQCFNSCCRVRLAHLVLSGCDKRKKLLVYLWRIVNRVAIIV
jgi:hypothetical protein